MKNLVRLVSLALVGALLTLSLIGCSAQVPKPHKALAQEKPEKVTMVLYFGNASADAMVKETREVERTEKPLSVLVLEEIIAGPKTADARRTLPVESKILSLEVREGVAYVNFSHDTVAKHWGGSAGDQMSIGSVVFSLTELPGIDKVMFLLEGEKQDAMFGHIATDKPVGR